VTKKNRVIRLLLINKREKTYFFDIRVRVTREKLTIMTTLVLIDDVIHHIASFLCVKTVIKEDAILCHFYRMRGVCRQFQRVIDTSLTLWQMMLSFTRRASIKPPPQMPMSLDAIREFVPLDNQEFTIRKQLMTYTCESMYSYRAIIAHNELDYTKVVIPRFRMDLFASKRREEWCENRLQKYKKTVKKMNHLCGKKQKKERKRGTRYVKIMMDS
jgi:hypothetical protein